MAPAGAGAEPSCIRVHRRAGHNEALKATLRQAMQLDPSDGKLFRLDTGTVSTLGTEHGEPVITSWNVPPA